MFLKNAGVYAKTIVAVFGAIVTALTPYFANYRWWPAIPAVLTVLATYLIPNAAPVPEPVVVTPPPLPPGTHSSGADVTVTPHPVP